MRTPSGPFPDPGRRESSSLFSLPLKKPALPPACRTASLRHVAVATTGALYGDYALKISDPTVGMGEGVPSGRGGGQGRRAGAALLGARAS